MDGNRCPECQNDLTDSLTSAIVGMITSRAAGVAASGALTCPHCGTELRVNANVTATITRQD